LAIWGLSLKWDGSIVYTQVGILRCSQTSRRPSLSGAYWDVINIVRGRYVGVLAPIVDNVVKLRPRFLWICCKKWGEVDDVKGVLLRKR
jgi:hypothetical protein